MLLKVLSTENVLHHASFSETPLISTTGTFDLLVDASMSIIAI